MAVELGTQFFKLLLELLAVRVEALLFLLNPAMVYFLEVSLLPQLVIGRSCLFCNDSSIVQLFLELGKLITELLVFEVHFWGYLHARRVELALRLEFVPFLLERLKGAPHAKLDEEVFKEFVTAAVFDFL